MINNKYLLSYVVNLLFVYSSLSVLGKCGDDELNLNHFGSFLSNNPNQQQQNLPITSCNISDIILVKPIKGSYFLKNLTNLTYWPQPAFILPVKICKNPVFGIKKLQETGSTSSQKSSQKVDQDRHRAKKWRNSWNWVRNLHI